MMRRQLVPCRLASVRVAVAARAQSTATPPPPPPTGGEDASPPAAAAEAVETPASHSDSTIADISRMATDSSSTPAYRAPRGMMAPPPGGNSGGGDRDQGAINSSVDTNAIEYQRESLYREALSMADPLGGLPTEDYFRDPAAGGAPRYAPRDFANGGNLDHAHPLSPLQYEVGTAARAAAEHDLELRMQGMDAARGAMRSAAERARVDEFVSAQAKDTAEQLTSGIRRPADTAVGEAFRDSTIPRQPSSAMPSWADMDRGDADTNDFVARTAVDSAALARRAGEETASTLDAHVTERFHKIHGLRERDAFEADRANRKSAQFQGYMPRPMLNYDLPAVVSPPTMAEAQSALHANAVPTDVTLAAKVFAQNTGDNAPAIGEALTDRAVRAIDGQAADVEEQRAQDFRRKNGFGRQTNLVTDAGPDQRTMAMHRNDERLLNASLFEQGQYADYGVAGPNERVADREHINRQYNKTSGTEVDQLLKSKFDVDRRAALLAAGRQDPVERSEIFYGSDPKLAADTAIRFSGGRKFQRHLEFFKPHPTLEDMQIFAVHDDVLGFPLLRNRQLGPYEFELFARYRAHHQQRRELALQHGLEPLPSETIAERDARRRALDEVCERTPFDASRMPPATGGTPTPTASILRQWFGAYWLPSPTLVEKTVSTTQNLGLSLAEDQPDDREHVLSLRYVNRLLTFEALSGRLLRTHIKEAILRAPEVELKFRQLHDVRKHFTPEQRRQYDEYVAAETERHLEHWKSVLQGRRFDAAKGEFGTPRNFIDRAVVAARVVGDGQRLWIAPEQYEKLVRAADKETGALMLDGREIVIDGDGTAVTKAFVEVAYESSAATGDIELMPEEEWNALPEETPATAPGDDINAHISAGVKSHFNATNYIEAQDVRWEERTATGDEGWTPALEPDELAAGMPLLAPRPMDGRSKVSFGELERAVVCATEGRPFFNPNPRTLVVRFVRDGAVAETPMYLTHVWQRVKDGPRRTKQLETREHHGNANRFVNFADPKGRAKGANVGPHFLDKYRSRTAAASAAEEWARTRNVRDVDAFNRHDMVRPENHRVFNSKHRRDYASEFLHRYTPWEFIMMQESDQPVIIDQVRADDVGPSFYHTGANKHWRAGKRRPHGFIKNAPEEVRDFFQYVDGVTPWEKAKKIRSHWDTREHHPMPYFNRPNLARHRNAQGLLPLSLFEVDRRTGNVKGLKDTLRDYRPARTAPAWSEL